MSHTRPTATSSSNNFQLIFNNALKAYEKHTKKDLLAHPLAAQLQSCNSPSAVLSILHQQVHEFDQSRSGDGQLTRWLDPTVNVLLASSAALGEGVGMVFSPAKVIFAGVGVLLSAAKDVRASQDTLVDIFERIENFFRRLEVYTEVPPTPEMMDIIIKIMVEVLSILAIATKETKQGRTKKYLKKLTGSTDIEDGLKRLDKLTHDEARMAQVLKATQTVGERLRGVSRQQLRVEIRRWLSPSDSSINYDVAREARHEGTAQWFLQSKNYTEWKSTGTLLWVHGKPGCGKSVLCSAIIDDIKAMHKTVPGSMAYFIFDSRDDHKQSCHDMAVSLLTQLSDQSDNYYDKLSRLYSTQNCGTRMPSSGVFTDCLKDMLLLPDQSPVYIIMDAIDECPNARGVPSPREEILEFVRELVGLCLPNLRLCVTCRPEIDIRAVLEPCQCFWLSLHDEKGQRDDIIKYVTSIVQSDTNFRNWREEDKQLVIKTLSERADGMFRWVSCQVDILRHCLPQSVRRILAELPESLNETYERILMEIDTAKRKHAHRLLQCLMVALRPLRVEELAEILAVDFDAGETIPKLNTDWRLEDPEQAVLSVCPNLVEIVNLDGSMVVQFSHPSIKEFLTSDRLTGPRGRVSRYRVDLELAHTILAQACLNVLLQLDDHPDQDNLKRFPLAAYAARHWVSHVQFKNVASESHIQDGMKLLFNSKPCFANWIRIYDMDEPLGPSNADSTQSKATPLYYAILSDLPDLARHVIDAHPKDIYIRGSRYTTAIHAALYRGHPSIARLLIENGADVNMQDDKGSTPLHVTSGIGDLIVVQSLLKHEAHVDARDNHASTPLHLAASVKGNSAVVELLLQYEADVDALDDTNSTPLHLAAAVKGNSAVVELLIQYEADVDALDDTNSTPLHLAASVKGNLAVVELLIQSGATVNALDATNSTPLHLALVNENFDVVKLLVHRDDTYINFPNHKKLTPLHLAAFSGDPDIVQLLLAKGADANVQDGNKSIPLHLASDNGNFGVVKLLLELGGTNVTVDARDDKRSTPLHIASRRGPSKLVKLLLERGANPNAQNDKGWTPLHVASQKGVVDIVQCLVERGADPNLGDKDGRTPLHMASNNKNTKVVAFLMEHGADPSLQDGRKQIPFQMGISRANTSSSASGLPRSQSELLAPNMGPSSMPRISFGAPVLSTSPLGTTRPEAKLLPPSTSASVTPHTSLGLSAGSSTSTSGSPRPQSGLLAPNMGPSGEPRISFGVPVLSTSPLGTPHSSVGSLLPSTSTSVTPHTSMGLLAGPSTSTSATPRATSPRRELSSGSGPRPVGGG